MGSPAAFTEYPLHHQDRSQQLPGVSSSCMNRPARCACSFLHLFCPTRFLDGVFSEAYERAVMRTILMAKVIDMAGLLPMYSATMLYRTDQNKVAEGLLLGERPSPCCKWASCGSPRAYL